MTGSIIISNVTVTVTLGSAGYPSPLTVVATGAVTPTAASAIGVVATVSAGFVLNHGTIDGAAAAFDSVGYGYGLPPADAGGLGVLLTNATLANDAAIAGGTGGSASYAPAGAGGDGVDAINAQVTNASTGTIVGGLGGGTGTISADQGNAGGNGGAGIRLTASYLLNSGQVTGGDGGTGFATGGGGGGGTGIALAGGSTARNTGIITGGEGSFAAGALPPFQFRYAGGFGAYLNASTLINDAGITAGNDAAGVRLLNGAILTNDGTITGGAPARFALGGCGVDMYGAANTLANTLANTGTITGGYYGVRSIDGGLIANASSGTIIGHDGVYVRGGGTVINAGTIASTLGPPVVTESDDTSVLFTGLGSGRLVVDPRAVFIGDVVAEGGDPFDGPDTLELASGSSTGTISNIGTSFTGFGTITVDPDANWTVLGSVTSITRSAAGSITGTTTIDLDAGSRLLFSAGVAATASIRFAAADATLVLVNPSAIAATTYGFKPGGTIDFTTIASSGSIIAGVNAAHELTLTGNGSLLGEIKLDPTQDFSNDLFQATSDGATGTDVTLAPLCFLAGTMIATPAGQSRIEHLCLGDRILTAAGQTRPIIWIGHGRVLATKGRRSAATPIIVRKGAFADNVPNQDLAVTRAHAFAFCDVLIPIEFLVNHRTIHWDDHAQAIELFHIELETHDVLLANGAPAESYRDDGNRWLFQNAGSRSDLPPKPACAPVLTGGPLVDAVWRRLLDRAGPRPGLPVTTDPDLYLLADGTRLDPAIRTATFHVFTLPHRPRALVLVSRSAVPQELGIARDPRPLGIALSRLVIRQGTRIHAIAAADPRLTQGFHVFEPEWSLRWTNGYAVVPETLLDGFEGEFDLVIHQSGATSYVDEPQASRAA